MAKFAEQAELQDEDIKRLDHLREPALQAIG